MGNCTSKNSKENKKDMKEEVYRPCQSDTDGQGVQSTQNGIAKNTQNSVETDNIRKETSDLKSSVDSKCHGSTEEKEQVKMPGKQESVEPEIIKSEVIKSQNIETEAMATMATDTNDKEEKKSECESMDPKVKVSDTNNSAVTPVNDKQDYTEIKGKPYNFAKGNMEKPDLQDSGFLDTKSGKTEPAHHNEDIKTDGSDQSPDQKDEKGGDAKFDNKKDEINNSNLLDCDQNGMVKSNGTETEKDNSGQTNDADSIPSKSAPSDGDKINQQKTGGEEFAFPTNNEFKKDEKGKTDHNEVVKSKTKKKKKKDRTVVQPGTTVSHHVYNEPIETLFIGCDNVVVKHEKIEEKRETTKAARMIQGVETMTILSEVAKSVGYIIGPKESGTCWRVGNDKIITAAHVVVGNIWDDMNGILFEQDLNKFRVDFDYISQQSSSQFKVIPKVLLIDKSLDIAVLQLKRDEKKPFPPPLKMFHVLNTEKDGDKQIYLISHNKSKKKEVNSGIGIWKPTEKRLEDLEKFCQQYGEENGYIGLERKDRLVIQCDFVGGASGSPGIVILNNVAYVVLVYIRGFPSFYHNQQFSEEQKRTFPRDKLFQHGVNIGNLFANMSSGTYIVLRNEIFPEEALELEQTINQHKLAISGEKTSSNKETTETSTGIAKGKMDNISEKSETKIPISKATACTDQSEDNIPESANYRRLMSHSSVPGQTFITSPQEDTDRYNITGNQSAQGITSPQEDTDRYNITGNQSAQDITSPQDDTDRYNITGNQSAQDIKTGESDKCTVQVFAAGRKDEEPQIEISEFIDTKTGKSDHSAHKDVVISTNEASPTDKATKDSSTTETSPVKKVDDLPTDDTGGNDSESVKGGSDQTKGIENNPNSKPSDKLQPDNGPSDNQQNSKPSDKSQPDNGPSDNQQSSKPSDKSQPENGPSDNQQSNEDPTGYEGSKFSKPGDEQDREISEEMKSGKLNEKKKKKKKKRDKYDGPPANTVIHHYYGHAETVNIGNDNINYYNCGKEEPKIEKDEFQPNYIINALKMEILLAVSKSVGIFHGSKVNGTCWRIGEDKIITAAHVVNDNIWNKTLSTQYEQSLDECCVDFNYVDKNKRSSKDSDLNVFKLEPQVMYKNEVLDVAVLKLKREKNKKFPPPLELFESLDPEKDDDKVIYLIGHNKSDEKTFNFGIGLWTPTETKMKGMEKFCEKYGKPNGYIGLDRKDRLVIKCEFVSGASGCPGVVIYKDKAYVVLVYIRGFPDFYYSQQFPERKREEFPKERLLQQGVNIGSVFKTMTENTMHLGLRNEIFPIEANLEQQASGQNPYAIGSASSFQNEKNLKGQETEKKSGKGTTCTEGHSETAIPDSAKYNRQPSYALAIDDREDIAFSHMKPPADNTDKTLQHGHSQNITVPRNEQNVQQETNLDVNKDSQSQLENASSEILDMVPEEKLVPYSNPGKTQPVKDITIENSVKHHQIRIRCDQGIPIKTIKDGMKLRLHSEGQLQTLTKPTGSWVSKLVICCDGRMVNIDSSCKSTSISTDNINLLKIKKDSSNYLQALLGNTDKEFEILMTLSTLLKINRIKPEDWLVPVIKHQHQMACYMLLAYMNEPNTNKEDAITNALKMAIEKNDKNITNTLCWFIIREYFKCVSFQIDGLLDVWPAMVCKKLNCHEFDQCSKDVVVVVEMVKSAKYLPKQFWNIPIEYLSQNDVIQIETKHSSKNTNVDVSIHDCFPEKFEIDGNLASNLFEKHSKLTFICKSIYTSKDCVKVYHPCVQLFCRRKGLIPIKENHFPKFINNVKTNILEGEPVFASRIRAGEQIKSTYYTGTLGGFVKIMGDITFITCAHVVVNKDVISGRKLSIPNNESTHIECVQISPSSIDTFRCGKLRYIEFKTDRPGETSIDAALIALSEGIGIDNDDFIANRRSNKHSLKLLGLKSPFLNENCLDYEKMFYGKHFSQFHNVTIGAISSISVNGSKIVVPEDKDDGIHVDLETIVDTFKRVMQSENQQNVQSSMFSSAAPVFSNNAHTQETRLLKLDKERTYRRLSRSMYNQIAVTHIPFKPGDSGTCVYVCDNSLGAYGCMGMAIANHPGPDGGVILTPMKEILKTFHVDIQ